MSTIATMAIIQNEMLGLWNKSTRAMFCSVVAGKKLDVFSPSEKLQMFAGRWWWAGGTFFQLCCYVSFLVVAGNSFRCYLSTIPVVPLCLFFVTAGNSLGCTDQFFGCGRKQFQLLLTYLPYQFCCCVSFLVTTGNSFWLHSFKKDSQQVSLIERESASKYVYFVSSNTLLLCISLLCIYLLYRTDPQTHRLDCFLKFPELSGQVGISKIPSKNADRKLTNLSGKHSFTQSVS